MDNSRRSIAPNEESISMYLSFDTDADDTLASKWQSVIASQTSQYLDPRLDDTLEEKMTKDNNAVLKAMIKNDINKDQASPLRPFDKSILSKHNALCSTPTKNITLTDVPQYGMVDDAENKENAQPDGENSTLSSTIDTTASTVKTNTLFTEANMSKDQISIQESNKTNIYPLSADVLLENITEVSNEDQSMAVPSPSGPDLKKKTDNVIREMANEVSELFAKVLKISESSINHKELPKSAKKLPTVGLPRPRRSLLPTAAVSSFKQRMSIVVKTTLNSPARKESVGKVAARRSCLPTAKPVFNGGIAGCRRSTIGRSIENSNRNSVTNTVAVKESGILAKPKKRADLMNFNCKMCNTSFHTKSMLDIHIKTHIDIGQKATNTKQLSKCKFCDKNFALERALHIHLMQNCDKIPPNEKRKLQYTELNHVKKAQLPKLVPTTSAPSTVSLKPRESMLPALKNELPSVSDDSMGTMTKSVKMGPPTMSKLPKKVAHAGVYRTPTKSVPCHICKQSFKSIFEYTNHCLTVHSSNQKHESQNAPSAQD